MRTNSPMAISFAGARVQRSSIMDGAVIKSHAWVNSTIVGWNSRIGSWCRVTGVSVLGEDVQLAVCRGGRISIRHMCGSSGVLESCGS